MRSLGRYALTEEIGRGSMGTVYKASDPLIERTVAVKTIDLAKLDDGSLEPRARFLREAKAAGRLNHPGIVTIDVAGEITAYARVMADRNRGRIAFLCRNVGGFGTANYVVDTRSAAETIFEEFANHLLGASSQFLQLATRSTAAAS